MATVHSPSITLIHGILLGTQEQYANSHIDSVWRLSNGRQVIPCVIPSSDLLQELLSYPLACCQMQLVGWADGDVQCSEMLPVLTAAWPDEEADDALRLLLPDQCPVDDVLGDTLDLIDQITTAPLRDMTRRVFRMRDVASLYWATPASRKHHHAFEGGLAVHSLEVATDLASQAALSAHERDLCIAAGLLHDIGKVWAYTRDMFLSTAAKAMGHELLGLSRLEPELKLLEQEWPDGAYAMRVLLSGHGRMRQDGSMPSALLARLKAADQRSCEQERYRKQASGAWTPVAWLPASRAGFDGWMDELARGEGF